MSVATSTQGIWATLVGQAPMVEALQRAVAEAVGTRSMTDMAVRLGVRSTLREDDLTQVLGTASVLTLRWSPAARTVLAGTGGWPAPEQIGAFAAPIAAGNPKPIVPRPPELTQV